MRGILMGINTVAVENIVRDIPLKTIFAGVTLSYTVLLIKQEYTCWIKNVKVKSNRNMD